MSIQIDVPELDSIRPKIMIMGVGGAGGNVINNILSLGLQNVDFLVANTDAQALNNSNCEKKIQLGKNLTQGLGAGSQPEIGKRAAEESSDDILECLSNVNMLFVVSGMGGGTGTGASSVISQLAKEHGILTVSVVTKPFEFEGKYRMRIAEEGIKQLENAVDTLLVIPNQNLFHKANERTTFTDAFAMVDDVLYSGIKSVTDLITMPGLINHDFADIKVVMQDMGIAMMGTGEGQGEQRATNAAQEAISNPLLDNISIRGARGVLINISGSFGMTLYEADEAAQCIKSLVDEDANIIVGTTFDDSLDDRLRVSVVATGMSIASVVTDYDGGSNSDNKQKRNNDNIKKNLNRLNQESEQPKENQVNEKYSSVNQVNAMDMSKTKDRVGYNQENNNTKQTSHNNHNVGNELNHQSKLNSQIRAGNKTIHSDGISSDNSFEHQEIVQNKFEFDVATQSNNQTEREYSLTAQNTVHSEINDANNLYSQNYQDSSKITRPNDHQQSKDYNRPEGNIRLSTGSSHKKKPQKSGVFGSLLNFFQTKDNQKEVSTNGYNSFSNPIADKNKDSLSTQGKPSISDLPNSDHSILQSDASLDSEIYQVPAYLRKKNVS